jgi:predicted XRE-type DNA-binding protein
MKPESRRGSGNVFADLGLRNPESALVKAELASRISERIEQLELKQVDAAKRLGIDQPKVSAILRGALHSISVFRLMEYLTALGNDVEIVVHPPATAAARTGHVVVVRSEQPVLRPRPRLRAVPRTTRQLAGAL